MNLFNQMTNKKEFADLQEEDAMNALESVQFELKRLSMIYDTIGDLVYDINVEPGGVYRFNYVNKAFCDIAGLSKDKIIGRRVEELIPAQVLPTILEKYATAIKTKKFTRWEEVVDYSRGKLFGEITIIPVFDENGICTNLVGSFHDITKHKQSEELIRISEEKWRSIVTKSPDGIVISSIDGLLEQVSPKSLIMYGFDNQDEVIGKNLMEFIDPSFHDKTRNLMDFMLHGHHTEASEFQTIKKDGTRFFIEVSSELIRNAQGEPVNFIHIIRDITARKQSEKTISMLAHAIRSVSECVSITDMEDRILFVNNAFLKTYQYDEQELTGKHIGMVRSPKNSHDSVEVILPATLDGGWHGELINRKKDGTEFPVYLSTSVIRDDSGTPVGLIGVTTDITDRKRAEQELFRSETRNKALLSAIPDLMFMFNKKGEFIDYHTRNPGLLMLQPELFMNRSIFEVLPQELAEETMHHLKEAFEKGTASVYEYNIRIGNEVQLFESRIVPCDEESALSIVRDITDQKKMESQMIQSERLAALGEMLAGMAHEINQPLNTLSMLFDNILFEAHEEHAVSEAYLVSKSEKIFNNIQRIRNIIDHVREFAREHEQEDPEPFNINESIANALSMVSEQYNRAGIEIRTSLSENLPLIRGNTFKFERIILNMILNSKDALLEKKEALSEPYRMYIRISTSFKAKMVKIEVEDNGCGIREEHMLKVLQPFYTSKETGKGTGLGLSISYGLIKEMNGTIDIQSKVMKGTRISISIPQFSQ